MSEVTKQDISNLHKRIDDLVEVTTTVRISLTRIETRFESMPEPPEPVVLPERPCPFFKEHVKDHKAAAGLWQKPLVRTAIDIVKLAIVAGATWLFVRKS